MFAVQLLIWSNTWWHILITSSS